jgi:hypothetical protein
MAARESVAQTSVQTVAQFSVQINSAVVQSAGQAYRLKGQLLKGEFCRALSLQLLLMRYSQALLTQMTQTAACNRHHSVDQQLCRWLLLSLDRLPTNKVSMTQQLIANMLGVRREGVTEAASKLQAEGLIRYTRGRITVLDRPRLEEQCCECYQVVKTEFDRLLPDVRGHYPSIPGDLVINCQRASLGR